MKLLRVQRIESEVKAFSSFSKRFSLFKAKCILYPYLCPHIIFSFVFKMTIGTSFFQERILLDDTKFTVDVRILVVCV